MGRSVIEVLTEFDGIELVHAYDRPDSQQLGSETTMPNVRLEASTIIHKDFDVLIDFSLTESALVTLSACYDNCQSMVIGVTGFSAQGQAKIKSAATVIPIVFAPNMSLGVALCFRLIEQSAAALKGIADIDISDMHHRNKVDSPSGTALKMGGIVAEQLGLNLSDAAVYDLRNMPIPRTKDKLGFQIIRAGDAVGEHTVAFTLDGESIEITHRALSRLAFARGAARAAQWVHNKPAGLYGMEDVLGL